MSQEASIDPRLAAIDNALYRISAKAIIVQDEKVLLVREKDDGWWSFPGGGIDYDEPIHDALVRELGEELGTALDNIEVEDTVLFIAIGAVVDGVPRANIFYRATVPAEDIKPTNDILEHRWYSLDELNDLHTSPSIGNVADSLHKILMRETVVAYDESAQAYEDGGFDSASPHVARFAETLNPGALILEVGCGLGTDAAELARANFIVTATDLSTGMANRAKLRYPDLAIDFKGGVSMTDLSDFPDRSFEAVIANFSLIHVPRRDTPICLAEFARVLQPKGRLFLALQEGTSSQDGLFPAPFDRNKTVFLHIFSPEEINEVLNGAGFVVTNRQVYEPRPGQHQFNKGITFAKKVD